MKVNGFELKEGTDYWLDYAVTYTEGLFNKHMRSFEKEKFTYKVQHLYVMKVPDQEYLLIRVQIQRLVTEILL